MRAPGMADADPAPTPPWWHPRRWRSAARGPGRRWLRLLLWILAVLIAIRLALPWVALGLINRALAQPGPYQGRVEDVSHSLWRGAYRMDGLHLSVQRDPQAERVPLLDVASIRIRLLWGELFAGRFVGSLGVDGPLLRLAPSASAPALGAEPERTIALPAPPADAAGEPPEERWQDRVRQLAAVRIERIEISRGRVVYEDARRGFSFALGEIAATVSGLATDAGEAGEASFALDGVTVGEGRLHAEGRLRPLAETPTFHVRSSLEGLRLPALNPIAQHLQGLTFAAGVFDGYVELEAADGRIAGSVKPLVRDLDVGSFRQDRGNAATRLFWRTVTPVAEWMLRNDEADQHGARIPIAGPLAGPRTDPWEAIGSALGNAFIRALLPGWEDLVDPPSADAPADGG